MSEQMQAQNAKSLVQSWQRCKKRLHKKPVRTVHLSTSGRVMTGI